MGSCKIPLVARRYRLGCPLGRQWGESGSARHNYRSGADDPKPTSGALRDPSRVQIDPHGRQGALNGDAVVYTKKVSS